MIYIILMRFNMTFIFSYITQRNGNGNFRFKAILAINPRSYFSPILRTRTIFIVWNTKFRKNNVGTTSFNRHISSRFILIIEL